MSQKFLLLSFLGLSMAIGTTAQAAQTVTGTATRSAEELDCSNPRFPSVPNSEAEADADQKADAFCRTFDRASKAVRVSNFSYSETCEQGKGYMNDMWTKILSATAEYNCVSQS